MFNGCGAELGRGRGGRGGRGGADGGYMVVGAAPTAVPIVRCMATGAALEVAEAEAGGRSGGFGGGRGPCCICGTYGRIARDCVRSVVRAGNHHQQPAQAFPNGRAAMPKVMRCPPHREL